MATVPWFKSTIGLVNKIDPARHTYSERDGVSELAEAYNIVFDDTGAISRRLGYTATDIVSDCHSLFSEDSIALFVTEDALCLLADDMTYTELRNVTPNARMSYAQVADVVYYMNGKERGYVQNGKSIEWSKPTTVRQPSTTRVYADPPIGSIVRAFAGRIWVAKDNVLWYSEPFQYNTFMLGRCYIPLAGKIVMVAPAKNGMYVSTKNAIYWLGGNDPSKFAITRVANYPAIFGTDVQVDGVSVAGGKLSSEVIPIWISTKGICVGLPGGNMVNLTFDKLEYPITLEGCGLYTGKQYICNLDYEEGGLGLCMNLAKVATSQFASYNFKSMCKFNDQLLGANENGIFLLDSGDNDNGTAISAHFVLGPTDFGAENEKRIRSIYFSGRLDGRLRVEMSGDEGEVVSQDMNPENKALRVTHHKLSGGRDIRGKYLRLKVANVLGSDFTVNNVNAVLTVLGQQAKEGV